jgi:hypothetical protein
MHKKFRRISKNQADFHNHGAFPKIRRTYKILRFSKNQADLQNLGPFPKIRPIYKILALF